MVVVVLMSMKKFVATSAYFLLPKGELLPYSLRNNVTVIRCVPTYVDAKQMWTGTRTTHDALYLKFTLAQLGSIDSKFTLILRP